MNALFIALTTASVILALVFSTYYIKTRNVISRTKKAFCVNLAENNIIFLIYYCPEITDIESLYVITDKGGISVRSIRLNSDIVVSISSSIYGLPKIIKVQESIKNELITPMTPIMIEGKDIIQL